MKRNVWDFPRPPALQAVTRRIRIEFGGKTIVNTTRALEVLETSHPPTIYVPPEDVLEGSLLLVPGKKSFCEWKGVAAYYDVLGADGRVARAAAWSYPDPTPGFVGLRNYIAFYPSKMDACYVDDEKVQAQEGDFYGGWITSDLIGPFKGGPGTAGW